MSDSPTSPPVPSATDQHLTGDGPAAGRSGRQPAGPDGWLPRARPAAGALLLAAFVAVGLWSLKRVLITTLIERAGFAEVYVVSGTISVLASGVGVLVLRGPTRAVAGGGRRSRAGLGAAALSGLFLALWYYGFYRALYGAPTVDATIIAFTWPLVTVVAMRLFSPSTAPRLAMHQWLLVLVAFLGAAAISVADPTTPSSGPGGIGVGSGGEIVWAFVAALGSGLYLPFAVKAARCLDHVVGSRPVVTFYAISVANLTALAAVLVVLCATGQTLRLGSFDAQAVLVCTLIGIGTYLVAEIAWTWALAAHKSLTLAALPYFSPALSVVLLHLFFDAPVRPVAVAGLVVILLANLTLFTTGATTRGVAARRTARRENTARPPIETPATTAFLPGEGHDGR